MISYKKIIMLIIILSSLFGCYIYLNRVKPFEGEKLIFNIVKDNIKELVINSSEGKLDFIKENNLWRLSGQDQYKISNELLTSMEQKIKIFAGTRLIEENPRALGKYGLEKPVMSIQLKLESGNSKVLLVGSQTSSGAQYYVKDLSNSKVYVANSSDIIIFIGKLSEFRDRDFLTVNPKTINMLS